MSAVVNKINSCCEKCKNVCFDIDSKFLQDVLYAGNIKLSENASNKVFFEENGYVNEVLCKDEEQKLIKCLQLIDKHLSIIKDKDYINCICTDDILILIDRILSIADISCCKDNARCDLITEDSGYDEWVLNNPYCQVFESWEASYYRICSKVEFGKVSFIDNSKTIYNISVLPINEKCDILSAVKVQLESCKNIELDYKANLDQCKIDYNIIVSNHNCNLGFESYVDLIECGIKHETIVKMISCGLKFKANVSKRTCDIETNTGITLQMCDMTSIADVSEEECKIITKVIGINICDGN